MSLFKRRREPPGAFVRPRTSSPEKQYHRRDTAADIGGGRTRARTLIDHVLIDSSTWLSQRTSITNIRTDATHGCSPLRTRFLPFVSLPTHTLLVFFSSLILTDAETFPFSPLLAPRGNREHQEAGNLIWNFDCSLCIQRDRIRNTRIRKKEGISCATFRGIARV